MYGVHVIHARILKAYKLLAWCKNNIQIYIAIFV